MTDMLGEDLQTISDQSTTEATSTSNQPAEPGFVRDASGNQYSEKLGWAGQPGASGSTQAGGTAGTGQGTEPGSSESSAASTAENARQLQQLQAQVQQAQQLAAYATQQAQQVQAQRENEQFLAQLARLTPDQQRVAIEVRRAQQAQLVAQQSMQQQQAAQQALEEPSKRLVVHELARQYGNAGVTEGLLMRFNDPYSMEAFCKIQSELARAGKTQQRTQAGTDRAGQVGSGGAATTNWKGQSVVEQLAAAFALN